MKDSHLSASILFGTSLLCLFGVLFCMPFDGVRVTLALANMVGWCTVLTLVTITNSKRN